MDSPFQAFLDFADIVGKLIVPLVGWVAFEVRHMNSRLTVIERKTDRFTEWVEGHDKQDDDRHQATDRRLGVLEQRTWKR